MTIKHMKISDSTVSDVLSSFGVLIFFVFSLLSFLRFIFSKVDYVSKYFNDKTNNINIILNHIVTYKNEIIIVSCIVLTLFILFNSKIYEIEFNFKNTITIFICLFGFLRLFLQLFFSI
ncbi:unnamed protein product, partial [marine sediment metagenome]